jgi:hypothetical protein
MNFKLIAALTAGLLSAAPAFSDPIILTFEGATSFASVGNFYGGGTDSAGASGVNYGVSFGGDALALQNDALGPYFSNAPTPGTIMGPVGTDAALNVTVGFTGSASFYYSATEATSVGIYSGLNGTGSLLGMFSLIANATTGCSDSPFCHWDLLSVGFSGTAQSIQFGTAAGVAGFDNVSVAPVPLPGALWLMLSGFGSFWAFARRKHKA